MIDNNVLYKEIIQWVSNRNVFRNGAVWLSADFHLHTKADKEFKYSGNDSDFCRLYIEPLKKQCIRISVISNHNKFDSGEFKELKKEALNNGIWLLPGVEFSLKEGIHIIIVFEKTWYENQSDYDNCINKFLSSAFSTIEGSSSPPYPNSKFDLEETVKELDEFKRDYFIVLAHVDEDNGLFKVLKGRTLDTFIEQKVFERVLAVQKSRNIDNYKKLREKSGRQITCVEGSDNAVAGIEGLGKGVGKVYLKIGDFNFDAVKYALMNPEFRVNKELPVVTNSYIKSISFEGRELQDILTQMKDSGDFKNKPLSAGDAIPEIEVFKVGMLQGVRIDFSSGLNSLIGTKGSGKSAVLEVLRYALDIPYGSRTASEEYHAVFPLKKEHDDFQVIDKKYKEGLVKYALGNGGKVTVEIINKQGELYRIKRIYGQKACIYKNENGSFNLQSGITLDAIFERPIYFGQNALSFRYATFEIDLVEEVIGSKLNNVRERIKNKKREIQKIIDELKKLGDLSELKVETEIKIKNAEHKLKRFEEKGIADRLKRRTNFETDVIKIKDLKENVDNCVGELKTLIDNNEFLASRDILSSDDSKQLFEKMNKQVELLGLRFSDLKVILGRSQAVSSNLNNILSRLIYEQNKLKEEFAEIKKEVSSAGFNSDDYIEIKREFEILKLKLVKIDRSERLRKQLFNKLKNSVLQLDGLWREEFEIFEKEAQKINNEGTKLSIEVKYKARKSNFRDELTKSFRSGKISGNFIGYEELISISNKYEDFIDILKDGFQKVNDIIKDKHQQNYFRQCFYRDLYYLLTFRVNDEITIDFDGKPLKDHSLGQMVSTLIIFLLTRKENDILIIDQPEDNLDNQAIYNDIIKEIKKLKGTMQFIFATHNANIPVLGDSEMVITCDCIKASNNVGLAGLFNSNKVKVETGSIDKPSIQERIIEIMEGGKEAFDIKRKIYEVWDKGDIK